MSNQSATLYAAFIDRYPLQHLAESLKLKMPPKRKKKILEPHERFVFLNNEDLKKKRDDLQEKNTIKADKKAEKTFVNWLIQRGEPADYAALPNKELDALLCKYWFEVRTEEGEFYKTSSLGGLRYGLNRRLQSLGRDIDIVHGPEFKRSSSAFSDACKELKAMGKGERKSYKEITPQGNIKVKVQYSLSAENYQ